MIDYCLTDWLVDWLSIQITIFVTQEAKLNEKKVDEDSV